MSLKLYTFNKIQNAEFDSYVFLFRGIGCLNGGAQIRPEAGVTARELTSQLDQLYQQLPQSNVENADVKFVYQKFLDGAHSDKTKSLLHTAYHAVEKMNTALNIKW